MEMGTSYLFLKKWQLEFDVHSVQIEYTHVWIRMLGLPMLIWFKDALREIINTLWPLFEVNNSVLEAGYMGLARIPISLDLTKGLVGSITIKKWPTWFLTRLWTMEYCLSVEGEKSMATWSRNVPFTSPKNNGDVNLLWLSKNQFLWINNQLLQLHNRFPYKETL